MKLFQAGLLMVFALFAMVAVFLFATFSGGGSSQVGQVMIWGPMPQEVFDDVLNTTNVASSNELKDVRYKYVSEETLSTALVEAIASGTGPDAILLPASAIVSTKDKLQPISYRTLSRRAFQDTFVQAGEVFLSEGGIYGLPFAIDPYVMYWNRTIFSGGGVARAPRYWDEFSDIAPRLTKTTAAGTLTQSAVALGRWDNIFGAKDILVSLMVGLGNPVVAKGTNDMISATLTQKSDSGVASAESALRFYTEFADPVQSVYSWNASQPNSRDAFTGGLLGVYLGPASEVRSIRAANPNLNYDVAVYPSVRDGQSAVPASLYAFSVPRGSVNPTGALQAMLLLTATAGQDALTNITGLPSVRRDALVDSPDDPYQSIFREAALNAFIFLDPNEKETDALFKRMVDNVSSGRLRISEAVRSAQGELEALIQKVQ